MGTDTESMNSLSVTLPRRPLTLLVGLVALFVAMLGPASSAFAACAGTASVPTTASAAQGATLCLVNDERRSRGLSPLRSNGVLATAAERHARDMAAKHYFAHDSQDGRSFLDRIKAAGYVRGARSWTVGENLAWGSGDRAAPGRIVTEWMNSPGHRANILSPRYKEIGFGMATAGAGGSLPARTLYATDFGARR